jgi:hypothetical protein
MNIFMNILNILIYMKLNIINYNPDITEDVQYVDELITMFTNVKEKFY